MTLFHEQFFCEQPLVSFNNANNSSFQKSITFMSADGNAPLQS